MRSSIIKLIILIITSLVCTFPQPNDLAGVRFNSKNVNALERTSVALNEGREIILKNGFSISFDLSFWSFRYYGDIMQIKKNQKNFAKLVFVYFRDPDNYILQLSITGLNIPLEIKLPKKVFFVNNWINVKVSFDLVKDSVYLYLNQKLCDRQNVALPGEIDAQIFFGLSEIGATLDYETAPVYLKNILIIENNVDKFYWSLDTPNNLTDKISGRKISLTNVNWLVNEHYKWNKIAELNINDDPAIAFDYFKSRLFISQKYSLLIYDLSSRSFESIKYKNHLPGSKHILIYDHFKDKLYSTYNGRGQVSVFDFNLLKWSDVDTTKDFQGNYYGAVYFVNPEDGGLYSMGGYGWFTVKSKLFKYNFNNSQWEEIKFNGYITQRNNLAVSRGFNKNEYYIFGGAGNESGKQEDGFMLYFDLHLLDLKNKTLKKIWSADKEKELKYYSHLYPDLYLNPVDSSIYFLRMFHTREKLYLRLFKSNLNRPELIPLAESFYLGNEGESVNTFFYFSRNTREFILAKYIKNSSKVNLYSLKFPLIKKYEVPIIHSEEKISFIDYAAAVVSIFLLVFVFIYFKSRKQNKRKSVVEITDTSTVLFHKNYVQLFGGFYIYDKVGRYIVSDFSPKLREIILLLILKSLGGKQQNGISSEELSSIIWPDSSPESSKTNRGVAINKIRKLLSSVDGVELEFSNRHWLIKLNNDAKCDYLEYMKLSNNIILESVLENESLKSLLNTLEEGEFLKGISYEWLDVLKLSVNNGIISLLKSFLKNDMVLQNNNNYKLKICDLILKFDSVDEDAFKLKIKTHYEEGNHHLAKDSYKLFISEYKRLYDESYTISFQEIISIQ